MKSKFFLFLFIFLFSINFVSAQWAANLNDGLTHYWTLNETSGNATDIGGATYGTQLDLELLGDPTYGTALIGNGLFTDGTDDGYRTAPLGDFTGLPQGTADHSIQFWFNSTVASPGTPISTNFGFSDRLGLSAGNYRLFWAGGDSTNTLCENTLDGTDIVHNVLVYSNSRTKLYVNGTLCINMSSPGSVTASELKFGVLSDETDGLTGGLEELAVWNRSLNHTEIAQLFNGGAGTTFDASVGDAVPVATLNSPADNFQSYNQTFDFNFTGTDDIGVIKVDFYINDILNETFTNSTPDQTTLNVQVTRSTPDGNHNWSIIVTDTGSQTTESETRTFTIDSVNPAVNIQFPLNITYTTAVTEIQYNAANNGTLERCWFSTDGGATNSTPVVCNTGNFSVAAAEGSNTWTVYANDTLDNLGSNTVTFFQDSIAPVFTIVPANLSIDQGVDVSETFTATDANGVTYSQNNVLFTINPTTGLLENIATLAIGTHLITVTATDPAGNPTIVNYQVIVQDDAGAALVSVCSESNSTWIGGAGLMGIVFIIIIVVSILGLVIASFNGGIDLSALTQMDNLKSGVIVILTVSIVMAAAAVTMATACTSFGVGAWWTLLI